jgi:hypothetical protein
VVAGTANIEYRARGGAVRTPEPLEKDVTQQIQVISLEGGSSPGGQLKAPRRISELTSTRPTKLLLNFRIRCRMFEHGSAVAITRVDIGPSRNQQLKILELP